MKPTLSQRPHLLFVYNADSGLFNALGDIGHKLFSPATYPCALCAITHGVLRERQAWRTFIDGLDANCEFLHRDQFANRFPHHPHRLPALFLLVDGSPVPCIDAATLDATVDLEDLKRLLITRCLIKAP